MGAYLSAPNTEKVSSDQDAGHVAYGASSMQGWRMSQEDAHNCCIDFEHDASLFAVYDGHGGHDVATYCSQHLPEYIKNTDAYKKGDIKQALIDAFLEFDATLATPKVISILKEIAASNSEGQKKDSDDSDVEENVNNLYLEAAMPLDQVMAKYKTEIVQHLKCISGKFSDEPQAGSSSQQNQQNNDGGACSSSSAGCSSSSMTWDTNETDGVSSSSQQCESSTSAANQNSNDAPNSSEADQVLDSTTSNGDVPCSSQVGSSADSEPIKASEMPDSSEDVDDSVSPSKVTNSNTSQNEAEVNGEKPAKSFGNADSSKNANDNECSSSSSPVENGELNKNVTSAISTSGKRLRRTAAEKSLDLMTPLSSSDSDDDDDVNDENFVGQLEDSDDDDINEDNHVDEEENDTDSLDDEDESAEIEDDEDDDEEDDDDDDEDDDSDVATDKPGIDSGCTAVVAILKGNELYVANAGDSRCVLCRDGEAVELSLDHKPEDKPELDRIVKAGGKVTSDGRVNGGLNLSRALGDHAYKKNQNLPPEEQMISALPDVKTITLDREKDEFMVLACDGIWNSMSSQNVINFVRQRIQKEGGSLSKICEELFDHCLSPNTIGDGTGCDNMTAIIVKFKSSPVGKEASSTEDVTLVTKKRPAALVENNDVDGNTEDEVVEDSKRMKTETC